MLCHDKVTFTQPMLLGNFAALFLAQNCQSSKVSDVTLLTSTSLMLHHRRKSLKQLKLISITASDKGA